ncbi:uncharacterized protein [Arachis hypogaea]|uniref:uncharacterized protein n=1 Tax=Arachis hypogaea TaxID=3818 RepID=UPI000DECBAE9|nr:uncharacterized protein LOC112709468 [Arachis hypogaea]
MVEAERLNFIRFNQPKLRVERYKVLHEFLKRGLPDAHILLFMHPTNKPKSPSDIERFISAKISDRLRTPRLYAAIERFMVHGPCGRHNENSPCMVDGYCSKYFPKKFWSHTVIDEARFPKYKRPDNGRTITKRNVTNDNSFIVPYNPYLLLTYGCHINVEHTCQTSAIKYLFKYVHKAWWLFGYDIQMKELVVIRLPFHLPKEHAVIFRDNDNIQDVLNRVDGKLTKLLAWFLANSLYLFSRSLTYSEFLNKFVWKDDVCMWVPRKQGFSIGRLTHVPQGNGEDYYLRLLLNIQKRCTSFVDLRIVHDVVYDTFKEAYYALGILQDDKEFVNAILEEKLELLDEQISSLTLVKIEERLQANGRSLREFSTLSYPDMQNIDGVDDRFLMDEMNFDRELLHEEFKDSLKSMTHEQRNAYDQILNVVSMDLGGFYFVYGYDGTRKIFLYRTLSASLRCNGKIVLNVASSGIASLLLPNGRTAHSRFKIPLNINEDLVCNIKEGSSLAKLLARAI